MTSWKTWRQPLSGVTELSKQYVKRYIKRIGQVESIMCMDGLTQIRGKKGKLVVDGFNCGYGGEGPHGLLWLLNEVMGDKRVSIKDIAASAMFTWVNMNGNSPVLPRNHRPDAPARDKEGVA